MGGLRVARDLLRPMIDGPVEYRMRRALGRVLPCHARTGPNHLFHACVWKTASQWVRLILSDPRLLSYGGHAPFVWAHVRDHPGHRAAYQTAARSILLAGYAPRAQLCRDHGDARGFFVMRDPRCLLASWHMSTRHTHRPNAQVLQHRAVLRDMSDAEAEYYAAQAFVDEFGPVLNSWVDAPASVLMVRFEDLTGIGGVSVWHRVLTHCGLDVPDPVLRAVLRTYRIGALAPRGPIHVTADKYAARGKRDHRLFERLPPDCPTRHQIALWSQQFGYA